MCIILTIIMELLATRTLKFNEAPYTSKFHLRGIDWACRNIVREPSMMETKLLPFLAAMTSL